VVAVATGAYCGSDAVEASGGCGAGQRQSVPAADEKARSTFWQRRTLRLRWLPLCTLLPHMEPRHHELSSNARESTRRASTGTNGSIFTRLNGKRHRRSSGRWLKGRDKHWIRRERREEGRTEGMECAHRKPQQIRSDETRCLSGRFMRFPMRWKQRLVECLSDAGLVYMDSKFQTFTISLYHIKSLDT
jgi:hypothetical protein